MSQSARAKNGQFAVGRKPLTTLDRIQAMERQRAERRQQMDERKNEKKLQEEKNAELGVVGDIDFVRMIDDWRMAQPEPKKHEEFDCEAGGRANELCICVRKRPLGRREIEKNDHDAVSCTNPAVIVHDCKHRVDGITKYLNNSTFVFDHAFAENINTDTIYECVVLPLVRFIKQRQGRATVFAYGQTGSGKTYTMLGIQERTVRDLFDGLATSSHETDDDFTLITLSFFEIYGGRCLDLLQDRARLQVREDGKGEVNIIGLSKERVHSPEELLAAIDKGNKIRTTQRTEANDTSSRSHAICQIHLTASLDGSDRGKLSLVDLAGSERANDTRSHSRQLRTESAAINKSLLALKECIRGLATNDHHVPFRASKLTMVLRDSFVRAHCRVAMIATVSPAVSATDHTINTLRYADRVKEKPAAGSLNAVLKREESRESPTPETPPPPVPTSASSEPKPHQNRRHRNSPPMKNNTENEVSRRNSNEKPPRSYSGNGQVPTRSASMGDDRQSQYDKKKTGRSLSRRRWSGSEHTPAKRDTPRQQPIPEPKSDKVNNNFIKEEPDEDDHDLALLQKTIQANGDEHDLEPNLELYRTVDSLFEDEEALLNAHMNMIQENAELLTEEGKMLQSVQIAEDYNIDDYVARLDSILTTKAEQITSLKQRLQRFTQRLKDEENQARLVRRMPVF
uniref:Kinesin-like protein n=1 Tax=Aureoumbra lagunensis TaxID=44058 RepID=A0A7S3JTH3_9STRA|eukprot:CAMPEP_0197313882 /NCGR_PEP_ID=MMETSP0891-20130614/30960_1 /TAXON_ID=44058 ORGANISM="Aureoumbra lagunensis, Strain CCMP1510" /NCGR_SAMPLE_ID=MMETSP0891 /ASSEMBLY_ACC=CAM_ASM_000534 /LENGTH=682 /DNA_ID=CAMNT_0042802027 /DNA_START=12 /DNA_END=2060 /DNA_ORIENTATION=+